MKREAPQLQQIPAAVRQELDDLSHATVKWPEQRGQRVIVLEDDGSARWLEMLPSGEELELATLSPGALSVLIPDARCSDCGEKELE